MMRRFPAIPILMVAWVLLAMSNALADDETARTDRLEISGWADTVQSIQIREPNDVLTSRARLRLELSANFDRVYGFVSADAEKNWQINDETGVDLHEAWLEHAADGWDLRVGRQIIIWGKADGVQITDIVSPPDYTESITRDLDEIRLPVDAAKLRLLGGRFDTELIWIPVFTPAVSPTGDNPWAVQRDLPENLRIASTGTVEPDTSLENSEIALKVSVFLSGLDLAASVFHTWDDFPTAHRTTRSESDGVFIDYAPEHHRLTVFGLEFSRPWSDFVFRGEAAFDHGRYLETDSLSDDPMKKDVVKWLAGVDWTPGDDWSVIAQITGEAVLNHDPCLADGEHTLMSTLNVSKKLLRQTLTLSDMVYFTMNDAELFNRAKVEYAVTDALHLLAGVDLFFGDAGQFGVYEQNSQAWIKAKVSF